MGGGGVGWVGASLSAHMSLDDTNGNGIGFEY